MALVCGGLAGFGVAIHDGSGWQAGLAVGSGIGAFALVLTYFPILRAIADLLSIIK